MSRFSWLRRVPRWHVDRMRPCAHPRTVLVTGATGFIGTHVCRRMIEAGHRVIALARDPRRGRQRCGPEVEVIATLDEIASERRIDAIVNLAGAPILGRRWTAQRRRLLLDSRLQVTNGIVALIARLQAKPCVLVSASAIGYYGVRGDEEITESDRARPIYQSHLCQAWELAAQAAQRYGVRVCRLRFGIVLGADGGAWPQLSRAARLGLRMSMGSGTQWFSWIHIADVLRLIDFCIDREDIDGAINATAPCPVRQATFANASAVGTALRVALRLPEPLLRFVLGEMAQLLVDGQRVIPMKALCAGFVFQYSDVEAAIDALLGRTISRGIRTEAQAALTTKPGG